MKVAGDAQAVLRARALRGGGCSRLRPQRSRTRHGLEGGRRRGHRCLSRPLKGGAVVSEGQGRPACPAGVPVRARSHRGLADRRVRRPGRGLSPEGGRRHQRQGKRPALRTACAISSSCDLVRPSGAIGRAHPGRVLPRPVRELAFELVQAAGQHRGHAVIQ